MSLPILVGGFVFFIMSMVWSNGVKEVGANKEEVAMVYLAKDKYLDKMYLRRKVVCFVLFCFVL
jgi:hypothetical protein